MHHSFMAPTLSTALFLFSPALYPQTPLEGQWAFLHGKIIETKERNNELVARARDEKGEWEAYMETLLPISFEKGQKIRAYGIIATQPDGKTILAAKWIKKTEEKEYNYCTRNTQKEWEKMMQKYPKMEELKPFEKTPIKTTPPIETKNTIPNEEENEFVSAHQLKIEREYV